MEYLNIHEQIGLINFKGIHLWDDVHLRWRFARKEKKFLGQCAIRLMDTRFNIENFQTQVISQIDETEPSILHAPLPGSIPIDEVIKPSLTESLQRIALSLPEFKYSASRLPFVWNIFNKCNEFMNEQPKRNITNIHNALNILRVNDKPYQRRSEKKNIENGSCFSSIQWRRRKKSWIARVNDERKANMKYRNRNAIHKSEVT